MLNGIQNFLKIINDNWTTIVVILSLIVAIARKIQNFVSKSTEEKIEIAKSQINEIVLKLITDAELDFDDWNKAGSIKRSQVIQRIYEMYPILSKAVDQNKVVSYIDMMINTSLKELHRIIEDNTEDAEASL